ncbi:hypothetical protein PHYBOEH_006014 [Phytophthora boehmeriae]|uniref:Sfi1 spindle body domain-containing protein n=1 Tax=Phytophthora boehmeriae TaxID=109152 RepID=A0A8T1WN42_9STRA|nr:hypothetical protein PHYBOEH_006014 [Phytophthora boehmeriae]
MGKQETRTVRRVLFKWQQLVNARQIERAASIHAQQSTQRRFWQLWSHLTQTNKQRRREQYEEAVEHEERSVLRRGVRVWQAAVKKQRERRFVVLSCVVKLESLTEKRVQEIVFRAWKKVIQCERRCRVAFFKHECIAAKRAVSNWFAWIREKQQMRLKLDSAEKFRAQRLVSAVFFYWQTYALAWQDAAKPIARRHKRQLTLPAKTVVEPLRSDVDEGSEDSEEDVRRPTSPVMKRLRQKKASRMSTAEAATSDAVQTAEQTMTLPDAVEISMDVKKRLILLGKWNPRQKPKSLL